ncbi:hypothetical protein [Kocuria tytonis]|uniref:Uncharacterized protein n=1 Tax=Kocuria tytonis TaxID=2054280 RepID=A0A495A4S9_9MICC|nr:hypothetical protein [Kocuria tytonis]RKQ34073.1 hypothetical protein C1C97_009500 [Kocuria tytonis]
MRRIGLPEIWDAREADRGFMASLATFSFVALGLELVVDGTVLTYTGAAPGLYPLGWQCLEWIGLGAAWLVTARALVSWSRRRGVDPLPSEFSSAGRDGALDHRAWRAVLLCFLSAVVLAIVLPALIGGPWGFVPVGRYLQLYDAYGAAGWLAMLAWAVYLVGRCAVIAGFLAYAHRAVRGVATFRGAHRIPWGGLVTGAVMGAVAFLSRGQAVALTTVMVCLLLGLIHVRCGESLRITAVFTVLVLAVV